MLVPEVKTLIDLASLSNPELLNKEVFRRLLVLAIASKIDPYNTRDRDNAVYTTKWIVDKIVQDLYKEV